MRRLREGRFDHVQRQPGRRGVAAEPPEVTLGVVDLEVHVRLALVGLVELGVDGAVGVVVDAVRLPVVAQGVAVLVGRAVVRGAHERGFGGPPEVVDDQRHVARVRLLGAQHEVAALVRVGGADERARARALGLRRLRVGEAVEVDLGVVIEAGGQLAGDRDQVGLRIACAVHAGGRVQQIVGVERIECVGTRAAQVDGLPFVVDELVAAHGHGLLVAGHRHARALVARDHVAALDAPAQRMLVGAPADRDLLRQRADVDAVAVIAGDLVAGELRRAWSPAARRRRVRCRRCRCRRSSSRRRA